MTAERQAYLGAHFYQPLRAASHKELAGLNTDPKGVDHTLIAIEKSYDALARLGVYNLIPFEVNPILLGAEFDRVVRQNPAMELMVRRTREGMRIGLRRDGIGTSFGHLILPDLGLYDKRIVIKAGRKHFIDFVNDPNTPEEEKVKPTIFWAPEGAYDYQTLCVLAENGYKEFICAPHQVRVDGMPNTDNQPVKVNLEFGQSIVALPYDKGVSAALGYKDKHHAPTFVNDHFAPAFENGANTASKKRNVSLVDGETHGLWWHNGDQFLKELVTKSLREREIQAARMRDIDLTDLPEGFIVERTSWSCPHENLRRWHAACSCCGGDLRWKEPFYRAHHTLNGALSWIVRDDAPIVVEQKIKGKKIMVEGGSKAYVDWMAQRLELGVKDPGHPDLEDPVASLAAAKASALLAVTSCGTYFESPGTSGNINIVHALQAIQHLKDAGYDESATRLEQQYLKIMGQIIDPSNPSRNGIDLILDFVNQNGQRKDYHLPYAVSA